MRAWVGGASISYLILSFFSVFLNQSPPPIFFPKISPSAFIPQTPFCGRENSAEVLRILSPENSFVKPSPFCCLEAYHTFPLEKLCASHRSALARGMPHSSSSFFWKKVRANDIMTPLIYDTLAC